MPTDHSLDFDIDLDDAYLPQRYDALRGAQRKPAQVTWNADLEQRLEDEWFAMGDQESWIDARPRVARVWAAPHKS